MTDKDKTESTLRARPPWHAGEPPDSRMFRDLLGGRLPDTPRLAAAIPPGLRAVGLHLSAERALNGMLRAGDRVDVVAAVGDMNGSVPEGGKVVARLAYTILHGLEVLHTAGSSTRSEHAGGPRPDLRPEPSGNAQQRTFSPDLPVEAGHIRVTLAGTPSEVERLVTAAERGAVWLALVPSGEAGRAAETKGTATAGEPEAVRDDGSTS